MNKSLKIGMAQMRVIAAQPLKNLALACDFIAQAALSGCDIVVLPECLDCGWGEVGAQQLAQSLDGENVQKLRHAARTHHIFVVAGLVERAGDKLYNAAIIIDDLGQLCLHSRKINELTDVVGGLYAIGNKLGVVDTRLGVLGLSICADNAPESLEIGQVLAKMGAQILLSPSAWAVPPEHDNVATPYGGLWQNAYGQLDKKYGLPVVGVSNVGVLTSGAWAGYNVIGCSLAMRGNGEIAAMANYGTNAQELLCVDIELRPRMR